MKRLALLLSLAISGSTFANNDFKVADLSRIFSKAPELQDMARYIGFIKFGRTQGTGVFVTPYHVLTAFHVIEKMECGEDLKIRTMVRAGQRPQIMGGRSVVCDEILFADPKSDVALLTVTRPVRDYLPIVKDLSLKKGLKSMAIGYTTSAHFGMSQECELKAVHGPDKKIKLNGGINLKDFLFTDCMVSPGMSGGAFLVKLEDQWHLAGVNSFIEGSMIDSSFGGVGIGSISLAISKFPEEFEEVFDYYE